MLTSKNWEDLQDSMIWFNNLNLYVVRYLKYQCIGFHTARRTFATNLYLKGMPTLAIMSMTGHTTEANFLKYIKVEKEEYAERNQEFFTGNKTAV